MGRQWPRTGCTQWLKAMAKGLKQEMKSLSLINEKDVGLHKQIQESNRDGTLLLE